MIAPLRHRAFRLQFIAQSTSALGNALSPVAIAFGVIESSGSARSLGIVMAAYSVSMLALVPVAGVWADRIPRHRLMMMSDIAAAIAQTSFALLLLTGHATLPAMVVLQILGGSAAAFAAPATIGLTNSTAPVEIRQQAVGLLTGANDIAGIVGPLLAGLLTVAFGPGWALLIDGGTFAVSGILLSRLTLPPVERQPSTFLRDLREGVGELFRREWLWSSLFYFAGFNFVFGLFTVLGPVRLAGRPDGVLAWSGVLVAMGIGSLGGSALATRIMPKHLLRWPRLMELLVVPLIICLATGAPAWLLAGAALLVGAAMTFPDVLWVTALQQEVRGDALSRVSSLDFLLSVGLRPVGYATASAFIAAGTSRSLMVIGAGFAALTLVSMLSPGVRHLTRAHQPEPVAGS